ncbi:hypothetical protein AB0903_17720 [Streptomyces sp. NPDC048389]|uniref:hypothetical protein n=1 Tax=Streptomyces sp. NPDC048389 TaxID=3154622 RepID=UPI003455E192
MTTGPEIRPETLASLVASVVDHEGVTFAQLSERAVDPKEGYRPSPNVLWKVARQKGVKVNPELVRAIAAGLRQPLERVQAAAAYEFTGLVAAYVDGGTLLRGPGTEAAGTAKSRAVIADWDEEESGGTQGNHLSD